MELLILILVFLLMGFSTVRLNLTLKKRRQTQESVMTAEAGQETAPPVAQANRMVAWLHGAMPKQWRAPDEDRLTPQFRAWVESALGHEVKLQAWLLALSPHQMQALVEHVAAYCEQLKVKLTWLIERQIDVSPTLKSTAQEIVVAYCTGIWKATQIKSKLHLFIEYQQFTQLTTVQQHQILQRELLARLAAQDLVATQSLAATLTGTEADRQAKVVQAIQQVASKDWERFILIFQTAVSQNGAHAEKYQ